MTGEVATLHDAAIAVLEDSKPLTASRLARRQGMSVRTLHRVLARHDVSFGAVLDRARLDLALRRLSSIPFVPIKEIAFALGFQSSSAFIRAFRRWTGMTPAQWRVSGGSRG